MLSCLTRRNHCMDKTLIGMNHLYLCLSLFHLTHRMMLYWAHRHYYTYIDHLSRMYFLTNRYYNNLQDSHYRHNYILMNKTVLLDMPLNQMVIDMYLRQRRVLRSLLAPTEGQAPFRLSLRS